MSINLHFSKRHLVALLVLTIVGVLAGVTYAEANHRQDVKRRHATEVTALHKRYATQLKSLQVKLTADKDLAVKQAVAKQKRHDTRVLKRVTKRMKVSGWVGHAKVVQ